MKVLLSIDEGLLRRIDQRARAAGLSRSAYLAQIAEHEIGRKERSIHATLARLDRLFAEQRTGTSTAAIRAERDAR